VNQVEEYILKQEGERKELMLFLHHLFIEQYALKPKLSYGIPFYYRNRWLVYLNPTKRGVEVAFTNGFRFEKYQDELEDRGRKLIRSMCFENLSVLNPRQLELWMSEALRVDDTLAQ
jgi:hypothetical protein